MNRKSPWKDHKGNDIFEGDMIIHPGSGETGIVKFRADKDACHDQWVVDYGDGVESRLCLQIGDKGRAEVLPR